MQEEKIHADKVTLKIPRNLYNRLKEIVSDSGFNSVTDFVVYVLRDLVTNRANAAQDHDAELTQEEVEAIRRRLKSLGYL